MRVRTGTTRRARHKKVLKATKGHRLSKGKLYKVSHEAMLHADQYAYAGRRLRKRDMRRLWITRINAGLSQIENAPSYNLFINSLRQAKIDLNRKMLAELATNDLDSFKTVVVGVSGK